MSALPFSKIVGSYFESWIGNDTWVSYHPLDKERFYKFVKAYLRFSRKQLTGGDIYEAVIERRRSDCEEQYLVQLAEYYCDLFDELVAFSKANENFRET